MVNASNTWSDQIVLEAREYQKEAISNVVWFTKDMIRWVMVNHRKFKSAALLEMATWSGKTFTAGKIIEKLIKIRNIHNHVNINKSHEWLNILVLTNRIDWLEQFKNDLVNWREEENKAPIISQKFLENINVTTFHSRADNLDNLEIGDSTLEDKKESFWPQDWIKKDNIYCSTLQTAVLKDLQYRLPHVDMIIIDEAHNIAEWKEYMSLIKDLSDLWRDWHAPLIVPITATPSNITKELFGEPIFEFWLAEYLASEFSPSVNYKMITSTTAEPSEIDKISKLVEEAKNNENIKEKKVLISEIEDKFKEIMAEFPSNQELVKDLLVRVKDKNEIWETILFAKSIAEANKIADEINKQTWENLALPHHSLNTNKNALSSLSDPNNPCKIVIAVWMLNESVDIPKVKNVVFWRDTDVAKIFLQQFWRWLRWKGVVKYLDYIWWLKNFSWLWNIHEEYKAIVKRNNQNSSNKNSNTSKPNKNIQKEENDKKFQIEWCQLFWNDHTVNLASLWFEFSKLKKEIELLVTKKEIENLLFNYEWKNKDESFEYLMRLSKPEILKIDYKWLNVTLFPSICGYDENCIPDFGKNSKRVENPKHFQMFIKWIFWKEIEEKITKEMIQEEFFNIQWKNKDNSYNHLINFKNEDIIKIHFFWKNIDTLAELAWYNRKWKSLKSPRYFKWFINWLFWKEIEAPQENLEITKTDIENYLFNYKWGDEKESYAYFMWIWKDEIKSLDYMWADITKFSKICQYNKTNVKNFPKDGTRLQFPKHFKNFIRWIYGKEFEKQYTKQDIEKFLFNFKWKDKKEESYKYLMSIWRQEIIRIGHEWVKITEFPTICWYNKNSIPKYEKDSKRMDNVKHFRVFINWIFWKKIELEEKISKEKVLEELIKYGWDNKDESYNYLMTLKEKDIKPMVILWKKIDALSTEIWYDKKWHSLKTPRYFQLFINWLYEK